MALQRAVWAGGPQKPPMRPNPETGLMEEYDPPFVPSAQALAVRKFWEELEKSGRPRVEPAPTPEVKAVVQRPERQPVESLDEPNTDAFSLGLGCYHPLLPATTNSLSMRYAIRPSIAATGVRTHNKQETQHLSLVLLHI